MCCTPGFLAAGAAALTWGELDRRVDRLAGALRERGVEPDDQVALVLRNGLHVAETVLARQRIGVVAAPLNTHRRGGRPSVGTR